MAVPAELADPEAGEEEPVRGVDERSLNRFWVPR
jgi:hypothetical protein